MDVARGELRLRLRGEALVPSERELPADIDPWGVRALVLERDGREVGRTAVRLRGGQSVVLRW